MSEPHESHHKNVVSPEEMQQNAAVPASTAAAHGHGETNAAIRLSSDQYYDIYQPPDGPDAAAIEEANKAHAHLYHAVRWLLIKDFDASDGIPLDPKNFPGTASASDVARFASVYGLLLADDFDPSMGQPSWKDPFEKNKEATDVQYDGRFVAAFVKAVQEYTTNNELFGKVLDFLRLQGPPGGTLASAHPAGHA